jgi:hypothetical protein
MEDLPQAEIDELAESRHHVGKRASAFLKITEKTGFRLSPE